MSDLPFDPFSKLNAEQREAVRHGTGANASDHSPLGIIAGAGSGKTLVFANRVAQLVLDGVDPKRILLLTFARRAAAEMLGRVKDVIQAMPHSPRKGAALDFAWAGTFHSIAARIVRQHADVFDFNRSFTILDQGEAESLMKQAYDEATIASEPGFPSIDDCRSIYTLLVNSNQRLAEVLRDAFPKHRSWEEALKNLFRHYLAAKREQNSMDFDDLLLRWHRLLERPEWAAEQRGKWDYVLVDEYQDTNGLQAGILRLLKPDGRGVTVVGDDAQAIYAFRGATVRNILNFKNYFEVPARIITLTQNYRSTRPILNVSNAVIELAKERHEKHLESSRASPHKPQLVTVPDPEHEAQWIADQIEEYRDRGTKLQAIAVLSRVAKYLEPLEAELTRRDVPFERVGGKRFSDEAHAKDVLAVLRFAENPSGKIAGKRALKLIPGVDGTADKVLDAMADAASPQDALESFDVPAQAREEWPRFATLYRRLRGSNVSTTDGLEQTLRWYRGVLERKEENVGARWKEIERLALAAAGCDDRQQFLDDLVLDPSDGDFDRPDGGVPEEDVLRLSTIHSAKGLEWNVVFVLHAVDDCIPLTVNPSDAAIEEERRLLYVALTRARSHLYVMVPRQMDTRPGKSGNSVQRVDAYRSRFIPKELLEHLKRVDWPEDTDKRERIGSSFW